MGIGDVKHNGAQCERRIAYDEAGRTLECPYADHIASGDSQVVAHRVSGVLDQSEKFIAGEP